MPKFQMLTAPSTILSLALGLLILVLGVPYSYAKSNCSAYGNRLARLALKGIVIKAEVVESPAKIYQGLSGRQALPECTGMLFIMPSRQYQHFCMRGMLIPIDIIWIADGKIIGMEKNISPQDQRTFTSPAPANYVLEVPGGFSDRYDIQVNDKLKLMK